MKEITKHRQQKMNKALEEKNLIRLWRKEMKLWQGARACNAIELEYPIRKGFKRVFTLRPDYAKSKDAKVYWDILRHINNATFCHDKSFMEKTWKSKTKKPIQQGVSYISHKNWKDKIETKYPAKVKALFEKRWHQFYHNRRPVGGEWRYHCIKTFMFVLKVEKYFITHRVVINPQLESETKQLYNQIYGTGKIYKIGKALGWKQSYDWESMRRKLVNKALDKDKNNELVEWEERYYDWDDDEYY